MCEWYPTELEVFSAADELAIARDPASPTNRPLTAGAFCLKRALFLDPSRWSRKG